MLVRLGARPTLDELNRLAAQIKDDMTAATPERSLPPEGRSP
jgi:hypothetical protein